MIRPAAAELTLYYEHLNDEEMTDVYEFALQHRLSVERMPDGDGTMVRISGEPQREPAEAWRLVWAALSK